MEIEVGVPFAKYAALLGGVASVVGNETNYYTAIGCGLVYGLLEISEKVKAHKDGEKIARDIVSQLENKVK